MNVLCQFFLFYYRFDLCGQREPAEDDESDPTSVSQRQRDNPAVCHLNSFRGGGRSAMKTSEEEADRTSEAKSGERNVMLRQNCNHGIIIIIIISWQDAR